MTPVTPAALSVRPEDEPVPLAKPDHATGAPLGGRAPRRKRSPLRLLVLGLAAVGLAVGALVVVLVVAVRMLDRPAAVPPDFRAPTTLPPPSGVVPPGHLVFDSDRTGNFELFAMAPDGTGVIQLTHDGAWDSWWPRLSPDRTTILFYRTPKGAHDRDFTRTNLWAIAADGSHEVLLRPAGLDDWTQQGHAEWAPDGRSLVMFGGNRTNPQIFVTDAVGQHPRPVTNRPGTNIDPSFAPDGRSIVFIGCPSAVCVFSDYELYRVGTDGRGDAVRLTDDDLRDHDPYYSPDGAHLAWLTQVGGGVVGSWDIRVAGADGAAPRRLINDDGVSSRPQWSADGSTIYFHRLRPDGQGFGVFAVAPDGSGLHEVTAGQPGASEYPST